jgi:hypothetical protein
MKSKKRISKLNFVEEYILEFQEKKEKEDLKQNKNLPNILEIR